MTTRLRTAIPRRSVLAGILLTLCCASVSANTIDISLVYVGGNATDENGVVLAETGDSLSFDLVLDATARPTLGGGFDINFESSFFVFESFTFSGAGVPGANRAPVPQDNRLFDGLFYTTFDGQFVVIATVVFTVVGSESGIIVPSGTNGSGGPWVDGIDFVSIIEPNFVGASVRVVPVPAAAWLMLSGCCAFLGLMRRKVTS